MLIKKELDKNGFKTFNKDVYFWKVTETALPLTVVPVVD